MRVAAGAAELLTDEIGGADDIRRQQLLVAVALTGRVGADKGGRTVTQDRHLQTGGSQPQRLQRTARVALL